ncbi:hypothetical protein D9M68_532790 [compost metagenome]
MGNVAPLVEDAGVGQAQRYRDRHHAHRRPADGVARPVGGAALEIAIHPHDQPGCAQQHIGRHRAQAHEHGEPAVTGVGLVTRRDPAQHHALAERGDQGTRPEREDPARLHFVARADTEFERDAAQHHAQHHAGQRPVELAQHRAPGEGKRRSEQSHAQQQPELVGVPPRAQEAHHATALVLGRQLQQNAHAQVEAVQHHARGDHHEQQRHEGKRHPERRIVGVQPLGGGQHGDHGAPPPSLRTGTTP